MEIRPHKSYSNNNWIRGKAFRLLARTFGYLSLVKLLVVSYRMSHHQQILSGFMYTNYCVFSHQIMLIHCQFVWFFFVPYNIWSWWRHLMTQFLPPPLPHSAAILPRSIRLWQCTRREAWRVSLPIWVASRESAAFLGQILNGPLKIWYW